MKIASNAGLALTLAGILFFQPGCKAEQKAAAGQKPQETRDKVSYSIGADIGNNLSHSDLDLNPTFLVQGIQDAFAGKTVLTDDEMKATLDKFRADMQAKMQAKQKVAAEKNKADADKFLEENKKQEGVVTTASGLQYKVIKAGNGPKPKASDTVSVNYKGTLPNGQTFDESKEPVTFPVEGVIPGWVEALQLMPVGSKWQLVVPPNLAYGEAGMPPTIAPNQVLVFEVELLDAKPTEKAAAPKAADEAAPAASATPAPTATPAATAAPKGKSKK
ncbi:MAG: FKBP-type peptidyl-prolyl cis-trans isomerase [Chthoniobacteraceae bacterium]|nr:FKBP-type peptidyl-prolyl cis-trans isomerase [Chthoniobacteraceae bacterium]